MKTILSILFGLIASNLLAQTKINKTIPIQKGQKVSIHFDYPGVTVNTWNGNEIVIQGTVSINEGENDDAFVLHTNTEGNTISIRNEIKDMKNIPHRVTVVKEGEKIIFPNQAEWEKYRDEHGKSFQTVSHGVNLDIQLEVKVPHNTETLVDCVYGMVEIKDFTGPLTAKSTYGGVDAYLKESAVGELDAETNYGRIYSNLDLKFGNKNVKDGDFHTYVTVKRSQGLRYSFSSPYGNLYLRKKE